MNDESAGERDENAEPIGSVAEEALKLFGALSDWAKEHEGLADGVSGMAAGAAQAFQEVDEHLATGSEECRYCPLCRAVHTVRELSPEVKQHLAVAGSNLMQAAAALLATAVPDEARGSDAPGRARGSGFEHISVDDDWPDGDEPAP